MGSRHASWDAASWLLAAWGRLGVLSIDGWQVDIEETTTKEAYAGGFVLLPRCQAVRYTRRSFPILSHRTNDFLLCVIVSTLLGCIHSPKTHIWQGKAT